MTQDRAAAAPCADAARRASTDARRVTFARSRRVLAVLASLFGGACADPQPQSLPPREQTVVDSLFAPFARPGAPGASVLVVRDDSVLVHRAFGLADVDAGVAATTQTNYRLASLTKQFTAMAVLQLVERGALSLDQRARTVLPELPGYAEGVTIRHLLTHSSGLRDYEDFVPDTQHVQVTDADALRLVSTRADRLFAPPGTVWSYSNTGYALLALIVERAGGMHFADFLRERIFLPLGMTRTVAHVEGRDTVPHRAYGHTVDAGGVRRTDQSATSAVLGDGGIYSSTADLLKWDGALTAGGVVGDTLWREATTAYTLANGTSASYGFGWFVETHLGRRRLRHHGETRGFTNAISRYPDDRLTIIVLTNRSDSAPWEIADRLASLYLR